MVEGLVAIRRAEHRIASVEEEFLYAPELVGVFFKDQDDPVFPVHHDSPSRVPGPVRCKVRADRRAVARGPPLPGGVAR